MKKTLSAQNLPALRKALINWGQCHWRDKTITSLQAIAEQTPQPALKEALHKLDEALFSSRNSAPDLESLLRLLADLRRAKHTRENSQNNLKPLYKPE